MEKLIELLNEFEQLNMCRKFDAFEMHTFEDSNWVDRLLEDTVISHRYWFIKWLIDNDKIDFENQAMQYAKEDLSKFLNERKDKNWMSDEYAMLLMLLAIQDEPLKFLVSIIK